MEFKITALYKLVIVEIFVTEGFIEKQWANCHLHHRNIHSNSNIRKKHALTLRIKPGIAFKFSRVLIVFFVFSAANCLADTVFRAN